MEGDGAMKNSELFRFLIKAYFEGTFDEKVNNLLEESAENKIHLANRISALCGVDVDYSSGNFLINLKEAIKNYSTSSKVVLRVNDCQINCHISDDKTQCQVACPFDAVIKDSLKHTTYIDLDKCTDCGFCIEACPNKNYLDKVEFLPLSNLL
jgi:ferredoxin hydrogenase